MRLISAVLALILVAACGSSPVQRRLGFLEADPAFLDFGVVGVGEVGTGRLALKNAGAIPVEIESFEIIEDHGAAFEVAASKLTLDAGATVEVEVTYTPRTTSSNDLAFLKVTSNADNTRELLVNLKGRSSSDGTAVVDAGETGTTAPPPDEDLVPALIGYGGASTATGTTSNAVWGFDPATRTYTFIDVEAPDGSPGARYGHAAAWDAAQKQMLVFGGIGVHPADDEVWALDFTTKPPTWKVVPTSGTRPTLRHFVGNAFDATTRSLYVYGGQENGGPSPVSGLYKLDVATGEWTQIAATNEPSPRSNTATLFDPATGRLIVAGGYDQMGPPGSREFSSIHVIDLRAAHPSWTELAPLPYGRFGGSLWLSPTGLNHYGGVSGISPDQTRVNHDEVLELSPNGTSWVPAQVSGARPQGRYLTSSADIGSRRFVFGGGYVQGSASAVGLGDLWEFDTATLQWTQLAVADAPQSPGPLMAATLVATE